MAPKLKVPRNQNGVLNHIRCPSEFYDTFIYKCIHSTIIVTAWRKPPKSMGVSFANSFIPRFELNFLNKTTSCEYNTFILNERELKSFQAVPEANTCK